MENKRVWARRRAAVNRRMIRMKDSGRNMLGAEGRAGEGGDGSWRTSQGRIGDVRWVDE